MPTSRLLAHFPNLAQLRHYDRAWLRGDVLAGLTVTAYAVPQCMAYAELIGLPPIVGLWATFAPLALYVALGSSSRLSVGPDATTAVLTLSAIGGLAAGDPGRTMTLAAMLALIVGAIGLLAWALRLGFLADLLSRPLLVGYFAALGIIMIVGQMETLTGTPVDGNELRDQITSFAQNFSLHWPSVALGATVLAFLLILEARFKRVPGPLIAVLLSTAVVALFQLGDDIPTVGEIGTGLPRPAWPGVGGGDVLALLAPALGIALVGFSQNVLVGRSFDEEDGREVDANQELAALGATNLGAGALQGFPVSNSPSRAVLADEVGGRSQLTSVVALVVLVVVVVALRPLLAAFPRPALAAIVIFAGIQLIHPRQFVKLGRFRHSEMALALLTMVAVLITGILYGILIAVGLSVLNVFRRVARPRSTVLGRVPGTPSLHDIEDLEGAHTVPGLVAFRYDAPLCFANAEDFRRSALEAVAEAESRDGQPVRWFLLIAESIIDVDETACEALESLRSRLADEHITFAMARVHQRLRHQLERAGLLDAIGTDHLYPTIPTALEAFESDQQRT